MPDFLLKIMTILFYGWLAITVIAGAVVCLIWTWDVHKEKRQGSVNHG